MKNILFSIIFFATTGSILSFYESRLNNKIPFEFIWNGKNSNVSNKKVDVINSQTELNQKWKELSKSDFLMGNSIPQIDFKTNSVLICYAGSATNGLQIDSTVVKDETLTVYERNISLQPNCHEAALLVTPFELIKVEKGNWKSVKEDCRVLVEDCK